MLCKHEVVGSIPSGSTKELADLEPHQPESQARERIELVHYRIAKRASASPYVSDIVKRKYIRLPTGDLERAISRDILFDKHPVSERELDRSVPGYV